MPTEKLIVWTSRPYRIAAMLVTSCLVLPVGPSLRLLLGTHYTVDVGIFTSLAITVLLSMAGQRWALRNGGEQINRSEFRNRVFAEMTPATRRQDAVAATAMTAIGLAGMFLVIESLDHFGDALGGTPIGFGLIALVSVLTGASRLLRAPPDPNATPSPPPPLRRILAIIWLVSASGAVIGVLLARQYNDPIRTPVFIASFLIVFGLGPLLLYQRARPPLNRIFETRFVRQILLGGALFGVPMGMCFSGMIFLISDRPVSALLPFAGLAFLLSLIGGLAFGAVHFGIRRLTG